MAKDDWFVGGKSTVSPPNRGLTVDLPTEKQQT